MNRKSSNSRSLNRAINLLLLLLIILAGLTTWIYILMVTRSYFGDPSSYLTNPQKFTYSIRLLTHKNDLLSPGCSQGQLTVVNIELGQSVNTITDNLFSAGVIRNADSFRNYLIYKGMDTNILAGKYMLSCNNSPIEIAGEIENHSLESVQFNILPGWRAEEIANALASSGIEVTAQEFMNVVNNPTGLNLPTYIPQGQSVEGFLFPGEYIIQRKISAGELVQQFVFRFDQELNFSGLNDENHNGLNIYQTITLASIIQRETYADEERPMISSVFYNRLAAGMKLETDPTVQYALGYNDQWGWWKSPLSSSDLTIQSAYNTYQISGLPPTPISNPDLSSIRAAENPESSDFYYFRAKCDNSGLHVFAQTFEEQLANSCN
ncbi:MAG: endolytic transglycosylase MltG [Anaerolineaceae bacterium]